MEKAIFTVPFDFTSAAQKALSYAIHVAKKMSEPIDIRLVHVINEAKEKAAADKKLDAIIQQQESYSSISFSKEIPVGNIFSAINQSASENESSMVFMGTHGMRGLQKFTGSYAMKVITSSTLPFMIVQEDTPIEEIKHIAIPIDFTPESAQIAQTAAIIAKAFNARITILHEGYTDIGFKAKLGMRINLVKETYSLQGIEHEIKELEGRGSTLKKFMNFVNENDCNMLSLSYYTEALFPQFDTFAQNLITNRQNYPCLIISAIQTTNTFY